MSKVIKSESAETTRNIGEISSHRPRHGVNQNPSGINLLALIREDKKTHYNSLFEQGFWALAVHRFGNWRYDVGPKPAKSVLSLLYKILNKWVEWTCGISLPDYVKVGRRVRLWHFGGMILHACEIGDEVQIRHNTTFGVANADHDFSLPRIEACADVGVGVVVMGGVTIGTGSVIGANAVVNQDVPPYTVAVGVPAKVIKQITQPDEIRL